MRIFKILLTLALSTYLIACIVLYAYQRSLIYFPQARSLGAEIAKLEFHTPDARLIITVKPLKSNKAVLYFGGNAEDVSLSLNDFSNAFPDAAIYLPHYRGYGGSSGAPTEVSLQSDALFLLDKILAEHSEVTVIGRSLGSGIAIRLASLRPISKLVLVTPYNSLVALGVDKFPYMPVRWLSIDKWESWRYAPQVKIPTTFIVAGDDELIPNSSSRQLYNQFSPNVAKYFVIPNVGHNSISNSALYLPALVNP